MLYTRVRCMRSSDHFSIPKYVRHSTKVADNARVASRANLNELNIQGFRVINLNQRVLAPVFLRPLLHRIPSTH